MVPRTVAASAAGAPPELAASVRPPSPRALGYFSDGGGKRPRTGSSSSAETRAPFWVRRWDRSAPRPSRREGGAGGGAAWSLREPFRGSWRGGLAWGPCPLWLQPRPFSWNPWLVPIFSRRHSPSPAGGRFGQLTMQIFSNFKVNKNHLEGIDWQQPWVDGGLGPHGRLQPQLLPHVFVRGPCTRLVWRLGEGRGAAGGGGAGGWAGS